MTSSVAQRELRKRQLHQTLEGFACAGMTSVQSPVLSTSNPRGSGLSHKQKLPLRAHSGLAGHVHSLKDDYFKLGQVYGHKVHMVKKKKI